TQQYYSPFSQFLTFGKSKIVAIKSTVDYSGVISRNVDTKKISSTPYSSDYGRFLRTYRWSPFIEQAEKSYRIETGLLAGLIMQESYGNPLQLNSGNDGGAGLMMFQPGTAREYGLKTYGSSRKTGRDKAHGIALKALQELHRYNYDKLSVIDERFHVAKSIDAGARFLSHLYNQHRSWDKAVSAYNRGTPALLPQSTAHVRKVRYFQRRYLFYLNN
ncbi:MAG: transglycosylase SLT domain-containing protein, partial [bacterium]